MTKSFIARLISRQALDKELEKQARNNPTTKVNGSKRLSRKNSPLFRRISDGKVGVLAVYDPEDISFYVNSLHRLELVSDQPKLWIGKQVTN